jgi:hypothetical protein
VAGVSGDYFVGADLRDGAASHCAVGPEIVGRYAIADGVVFVEVGEGGGFEVEGEAEVCESGDGDVVAVGAGVGGELGCVRRG